MDGGLSMIYLDNAATTLKKPASVRTAVRDAMLHAASAGRSAYRPAMLAADILYDTRLIASSFFDVDGVNDIIFTFNATHALNIAINSISHHVKYIAFTGIEHNSTIRPLAALSKRGITVMPLNTPLWQPERFLDEAEQACRSGIECFVVNHVSNVFGYRLPIEELDEILQRYGAVMILDASQSAGICPISARSMPSAAAICMPGHKGLYGPQGTGLLLTLHKEVREPLMLGGTGSESLLEEMPAELPDRLEAGTHNIAGIAGLFEGIRFVSSIGTENILRHEQSLQQLLSNLLGSVEGIRCYSSPDTELQTGVLSVVPDGMSAEELAQALAERGICVRAGLHCAPCAHKTAGTLKTGTVRFSPGWFQSARQIRKTADAVRDIMSSRAHNRAGV